MKSKSSSKSKAKSKPKSAKAKTTKQPKLPKSPKLPPKVIVSARVSVDVRKALAAVQKKLKHGNISETVAKAIDEYLANQKIPTITIEAA